MSEERNTGRSRAATGRDKAATGRNAAATGIGAAFTGRNKAYTGSHEAVPEPKAKAKKSPKIKEKTRPKSKRALYICGTVLAAILIIVMAVVLKSAAADKSYSVYFDRGSELYESLFAYLSCNQHIISMRKRQMAVIAAFDPAVAGSLHAILASPQNNLNDFVPEALLDKLATEMSVLFDLWHQNGSLRAAASTAESVEGVVENFQKKILPWEESGKDEVATRKKQDIVLVASLVNKMSR